MSTSVHAHRPRRLALAAVTAAAALAALTACGSSSSSTAASAPTAGQPSSGQPSSAAPAGGSPAAVSTAIPTQDVVSGVATDSALAAELPASVRSAGGLTLGTTLAPGTSGLPHGGQLDGKDIGLDVDLRNAVAKVLGTTWKVSYGTFATVIPGVQNGKFQVGQDNFGVTKAREQVVDFASYLTDGQALLGSQSVSLSSVSKVTDACGLTVGTVPGSTFQQILTTAAGQCSSVGKPAIKAQYFADQSAIILGLQNGKLDAYFGPTLSLQYDATHVPDTKFLGQVSSTTVGFVTAKGSPIAKALSDAVNELIKNGDYAKILGKWGIATSSGITSSQVDPAASL